MEHHHHHSPTSFNRAFAIGIGLNSAFVAIELFYGWQARSLALIADAGHNLSDIAALLLAWFAVWAGQLQPGPRHTYGWQRGSILAAFTNAVILLVAMGALALEAIERLQQPQAVAGTTVMVVAGIGVVINGLTAWLFMKGSAHDLNLRGAFLHMAADALISLAVVIAGGLYLLFQWSWIDPVMSLAIVTVIIVGTWGLLKQSLHLLFDGVPDAIDPQAVHDFLASQTGVVNVHDLHIWAMSTSGNALTAHLVMPDGHPGDAFLQRLEHELHERFDIDHPTLQIEQADLKHGCHNHFGQA